MKKIFLNAIKWGFVKSGCFNIARAFKNQRHFILTFHKVRPSGVPVDPFDTCPSVSADVFRNIVAYVNHDYDIVPLRYLCDNLNSKTPMATITFDDGWRDNYSVAFPILKELECTATIFMTMGKIGSSEPFWQQRLGEMFRHNTGPGTVESEIRLRDIIGMDKKGQLNQLSYYQTVNRWKNKCLSDVEDLLSRSGEYKPIYQKTRIFLDRDEIEELAMWGIDFGSHTMNHIIATSEPLEVVRKEFLESKKALEKIIRQPIDILSYPNGSVSSEVIQIAKMLGYRVGCSTRLARTGERDDPMALPRIDADWDRIMNRDGNVNPYLFQWVVK